MPVLARRLLPVLALMAGLAAAIAAPSRAAADSALPPEPLHPSLAGATGWLGSPALTLDALRGKVVLVDFWTYSCINCLRTLPWLRAWQRTYADQGLVIVGVHAPEFEFEHDPQRVRRALREQGIAWPVALDDGFVIWRSFRNEAWPALYFIDAQGRVRHHRLGEGGYEESERVIRQLLMEARGTSTPLPPPSSPDARGIGLQADLAHVRSRETYLGAAHADGAAPAGIRPGRAQRHVASMPRQDAWTLEGTWIQRPEFIESTAADGAIAIRFHARDLNLVLGPGPDGRPVAFSVSVDGKPPGADHGVDVDARGRGQASGERLYQLVRQQGDVVGRTFEIRFERPGARAWVFTFG